MAPTVIAFDLYGTLLSTGSIAQQLATFYSDEKASTIAAQARRYQLEYTWRINSMGEYAGRLSRACQTAMPVEPCRVQRMNDSLPRLVPLVQRLDTRVI